MVSRTSAHDSPSSCSATYPSHIAVAQISPALWTSAFAAGPDAIGCVVGSGSRFAMWRKLSASIAVSTLYGTRRMPK